MKFTLAARSTITVCFVSSVVSADSKDPQPKFDWELTTYSNDSGTTISHPANVDTHINLPFEIAKEWDCIVSKVIVTRNGLSQGRTLNCFHKNFQGLYTSMAGNMSECRLDKVRNGNEVMALTIAVVETGHTEAVLKGIHLFLACF